MTEKHIAPYGSWRSPITSDLIVAGTVGLREIRLDGDDIYWIEGRPAEGGRNVIVRRTPDGQTTDMFAPPFYSRTRVHEYGGGDYLVSQGTIYFVNFSDQRLYRQNGRQNADANAEPQPLTPAAELRYADMIIDERRNLLYAVREDHRVANQEATNTIVKIQLSHEDGGEVLASGFNFYSSPRLSPDGKYLAWLSWNHPNMPWDGTELWVGELDENGSIINSELVAGGKDESIFQPEWSPDGTLYFISDRTNWWNLYRRNNGQIEAVYQQSVEFGKPQWGFGMSTYGFESPTRIICSYTERGFWQLASLDLNTQTLSKIEIPYTELASIRVAAGRALFCGGAPTEPNSVVYLDLKTSKCEVLRRASNITIEPEYCSTAMPIEFPTENGLTAHAFYYPPQNRDYQAPVDELPPLLVKSHGGPTSSTSAILSLTTQYWTSHGFAVLDVNYGGSTGYGREYRQRLNGTWGIVDVDDCVHGARFLVTQRKADKDRLAIDGGSAGGYTTLCALTFRDIFKAGASFYGVSDLTALAEDTHKFESRYLDTLIGPYPATKDLYLERSPINFTDRLSCPVIIFQGLEDKVVPPNQAEMMVEALRKKGLPVAYVPFEGEQHGFRRAENIKRTLDAELYFYARIFGFKLADPVEPVKIDNLPE